jgi:peptidyl-prolyl cis-trans isomerase D
MLDLMRRKKRLKAVLWLVIVSLGLGMLLFFVPGQNIGSSGFGSSVASVDGDPIPVQDFVDTYRRFVDNFSAGGRNKTDPETLKALGVPRQALDALISVRVVGYAARRLGLDVTNEEIQRAIESNPNLQDRGVFVGVERYKQVLEANRIGLAQFEEGVRSTLLADKVRKVVTDSLRVSDRELRDEYLRTNQEAQLRFVQFKRDDFRSKVKPVESDLRSYFEPNRSKYAIKEQRRGQFLLLSLDSMASTIQVTEQELRSEWERRGPQETVDASHILLEVKDPAKEAEVRAQAEDLAKRAKAGEDFADLAKKYSQDPGSASQGGNLGPFTRGRMVKGFEDAAFAAKPGDIVGPVRTQFGFHIIKVLRHEVPTFETSRASLARSLQLERAAEMAKKKAAEAKSLVSTEKDLAKIAKAIGVPAEIKDIPFLAKDTDAYDQGIPPQLVEELFRLKDIGSVGNPVEIQTGQAVPKLLETRLPKPAEFAEVKAQVEKDYIDVKAGELLKAAAKAFADEAKALGDLEKAAQKAKLALKTTTPFKRDGIPDPDLGNAPLVTTAAFDLAVGSISDPLSYDSDNRAAVIQVVSRSPFDEAAFAKQKAQVREQVLSYQRDAYFQEYIRKMTEDLEKSGKIRVNNTAVEQLTGIRS